MEEIRELSFEELKDVNGGFVCLGACIVGLAAGAAFLAGFAIGIALAD